MADEQLQYGEVEFYNGTSYGFIKRDDGGPDTFFHIAELATPGKTVKRGDRVTFNIEPDIRKPSRMRAVKVRVHK
jgi:cold shock CspA family protein